MKVAAILRNVEGAPLGLNRRVVRDWYHGEIERANAAHRHSELADLAAMSDQPGAQDQVNSGNVFTLFLCP